MRSHNIISQFLHAHYYISVNVTVLYSMLNFMFYIMYVTCWVQCLHPYKSNPTLHSFQRIATPGAAVDFNIKYDKVYQLWRTCMSVKQSEDLTTQSALLSSQPTEHVRVWGPKALY